MLVGSLVMLVASTLGAAASAALLDHLGLDPRGNRHWYLEITVESDEPATRLEINIYPEEWGFVLRAGPRVSSIRVTDVPFVHGSDDHRLLDHTPPLARIPEVLGVLEARLGITFERTRATVRSSFVRAAAVVRSWLVEGMR